jgi:hypothetical protein
MLPDFNEETGYLPPGVHYATLEEIKERFGKTVRRSRLVVNLDKVVRQLWDAGVQEVFIDGSFCTATPVPNDIDGYWIYIQGFDRTKVDPVLLQMDIFVADPSTGEAVRPMKLRYGVEFFVHPLNRATASGLSYPEFFSRSRDGVDRGYVGVIKDEKRGFMHD